MIFNILNRDLEPKTWRLIVVLMLIFVCIDVIPGSVEMYAVHKQASQLAKDEARILVFVEKVGIELDQKDVNTLGRLDSIEDRLIRIEEKTAENKQAVTDIKAVEQGKKGAK